MEEKNKRLKEDRKRKEEESEGKKSTEKET